MLHFKQESIEGSPVTCSPQEVRLRRSQEPLWPHNPGINAWEEFLVKSVKPLPFKSLPTAPLLWSHIVESIKEQGRWKREDTRSYWIMETKEQQKDDGDLSVAPAPDSYSGLLEIMGVLLLLTSLGTHLVSSAIKWRTRVCILQGCEACVLPKQRAVPLYSQSRHKIISFHFSIPVKLPLWL